MTLVLVITGAALASVFIFRLQPQVGGGASCASGLACDTMPANAAAFNFAPANITVFTGVNNTIQWTNQDTIQHTVVVCPIGGGQVCSPSKAIASSPILSHGDTFEVTLNSTGSYHFYCSIHPATMRGTIVVKAGPTTTST
jgi:plastocyanin